MICKLDITIRKQHVVGGDRMQVSFARKCELLCLKMEKKDVKTNHVHE